MKNRSITLALLALSTPLLAGGESHFMGVFKEVALVVAVLVVMYAIHASLRAYEAVVDNMEEEIGKQD